MFFFHSCRHLKIAVLNKYETGFVVFVFSVRVSVSVPMRIALMFFIRTCPPFASKSISYTKAQIRHAIEMLFVQIGIELPAENWPYEI